MQMSLNACLVTLAVIIAGIGAGKFRKGTPRSPTSCRPQIFLCSPFASLPFTSNIDRHFSMISRFQMDSMFSGFTMILGVNSTQTQVHAGDRVRPLRAWCCAT